MKGNINPFIQAFLGWSPHEGLDLDAGTRVKKNILPGKSPIVNALFNVDAGYTLVWGGSPVEPTLDNRAVRTASLTSQPFGPSQGELPEDVSGMFSFQSPMIPGG